MSNAIAHPQRPITDESLQALQHFCASFAVIETRKMLHRMVRAAFAQKDLLDKKDILSLLYLKEELVPLIHAAETLAKDKAAYPPLKKLFANNPAGKWIESLDVLFHAAAYDGFFTCPPQDTDIYYTHRRFFKLVDICFVLNAHNNTGAGHGNP